VIKKVTVIGTPVVLVSVPDMLPVPLAAIPCTRPLATSPLSRVQLNTVPTTLPVSTIVVIGLAEQIVWLDGVATAFGIGFTVTVAVVASPVQVTPALV